MTFAEAFAKVEKPASYTQSMEQQEAQELGISFETYMQWKNGFADTYKYVTERVN